MIRKYAEWNAKSHERVAARWRERPFLMSALFVGVTVTGSYLRQASTRRLQERVARIEADIAKLSADMYRVKMALRLPDQPTERERIAADLRRAGTTPRPGRRL